MWKYYYATLRDIPQVFRGTVEAYAFWVLGFVALVTSLWPRLADLVQRHLALPRWSALVALFAVLLYGILRVNYQRYKERDDRVKELEALPSELYTVACDLRDFADPIYRRIPMVSDDDRQFVRAGALELWRRMDRELRPRLNRHDWLEVSELFNDKHANGPLEDIHGHLWQLIEKFKTLAHVYSPYTLPAPSNADQT